MKLALEQTACLGFFLTKFGACTETSDAVYAVSSTEEITAGCFVRSRERRINKPYSVLQFASIKLGSMLYTAEIIVPLTTFIVN